MASLHLISIAYVFSKKASVFYIIYKWKLKTMSTNFGSRTIPEQRKELKKFGAKKSGQKRELVER